MTAQTDAVLLDIAVERGRQYAKWGVQRHQDGTGLPGSRELADWARAECKAAPRHGGDSWMKILREEVYEAFAESDPAALRDELVQVAAVAVQWIELLDQRAVGAPA